MKFVYGVIIVFMILILYGQSRPKESYKESIFDNVFVINLENRPDRWNTTQERLKSIGINNAKKWVATQGDPSLTEAEMSKNEYACYMSHRRLWEHIYKSKIPYAIIFEDDIVFEKSITKQSITDEFNYTLKNDKNFDVIFLGYCFGSDIFKEPLTKKGQGLCLHAYLVSRNGVEKLLKMKLDKPVDKDVYKWCKNNRCYLSRDTDNQDYYGNGIIYQDRNVEGDIRSNFMNNLQKMMYQVFKKKNT